jgi:hypothetical protein
VSARLAAVGAQLRHATNARHAADKGQPFAVAGAVWGPRLSHVGSHAAKMTAQGKHGNSGNLLKGRRGVRPASGRGTANPPQAPRQTDPWASRYVTSAGHCRGPRSFTGLDAGATASLRQHPTGIRRRSPRPPRTISRDPRERRRRVRRARLARAPHVAAARTPPGALPRRALRHRPRPCRARPPRRAEDQESPIRRGRHIRRQAVAGSSATQTINGRPVTVQ